MFIKGKYILVIGLLFLIPACASESRTQSADIDSTDEISEVAESRTKSADIDSTDEVSQVTETFEIVNKHPKLDCLNKTMDVFIDVFGIWIISTKSAPENYVLHTANILAEFIDNDLDGIADDANVLKHLVENNYVVPVWTSSIREEFWKQSQGTYCEDNIGMAASMYFDEDQWALGGIKETGIWDTNLEEVWHVISYGWYQSYPQSFGNQDDTSRLREAMDMARGGEFYEIPNKYPEDAWYKYYDATCDYNCQVSEYFYWALMSNIGALEPALTNKCERSKHEWNICTKSDLQKIDKSVYDLMNDPDFQLPINIPQGRYKKNKAEILNRATPVPTIATPVPEAESLKERLIESGWNKLQNTSATYVITSDLNQDTRTIVEEGISTGEEYLGNYGPLKVFIIGEDIEAANIVAEMYCRWAYSPDKFNYCFEKDQGIEIREIAQYKGMNAFSQHSRDPMISNQSFIIGNPTFGLGSKIGIHEYIHVYQNAHKWNEEDIGLPVWLEEGSAEFLAQYLGEKKGWTNFKDHMLASLKTAKELRVKHPDLTIKDIETSELRDRIVCADGCTGTLQYETGEWATALLIYDYADMDVFYKSYIPDIFEIGGAESFHKHFGLTLEQFYIAFEEFMNLTEQEQMIILN